MRYLTTKQTAERWGISDRRVRVLAREGRIPGVIEENGSYLIPEDAAKPEDKRYKRRAEYLLPYEEPLPGAASGTFPYRQGQEASDREQDINGFFVPEVDEDHYGYYGPRLQGPDAPYSRSTAAYVREAPSAARPGKPVLYLKWEDDVIGFADEDFNVHFTQPLYNAAVTMHTRGKSHWSRFRFESFLADRIVSRDRRDIEKILFRLGLSSYDIIRVGLATRAVNASDLLWITEDPKEKMQDALTQVFRSVFLLNEDTEGGSVDTPEGSNIKRYGVYQGKYGIFKKRISPVTTDAESELAVWQIARRMGVPCCPVFRIDQDTVFSQFEYNFASEFIVHMRRLIDGSAGTYLEGSAGAGRFRDTYLEGSAGSGRFRDTYLALLSARPEYQADIVRMIALDFVTRQDDRHLSNIAVKIGPAGESFYPLYDNGRSLFYEDTEETAARACLDPILFSTTFGPSGSYWDYVKEISESGIVFGRLMKLDLPDNEIRGILEESGFRSYRLEAGCRWISEALKMLRELDGRK